jgi:adenylosuccinate lyase
MISRYSNPLIAAIFSNERKFKFWQKLELAVLKARANLGRIENSIYEEIEGIFLANPIDVEWLLKREEETQHDLNAFLDERVRLLPLRLQSYFHQDMTSYDTEEAPFAGLLKEAADIITNSYADLDKILVETANMYHFTIMFARTHFQGAELESFGSRVLTWLAEIRVAYQALNNSLENLNFSKLSGAIGKYGDLDKELEQETLKIMGFLPFYGSTQIMPRVLYAPIAQNLSNLAAVVDKIATDIRLSAGSGLPLMQEPFGKNQKGSSAMPHKKNTILCERIEGFARLAKGRSETLSANIKTWLERSIEQSSVERVDWPDLFHVVDQALKILTKVLSGLNVYPDNMLEEIVKSRGTYASAAVKEFLKEKLAPELGYEDAYRIVQLASFNVFEPSAERQSIRNTLPRSLDEAQVLLDALADLPPEQIISIQNFIPLANLRYQASLNIPQDRIEIYNEALRKLFSQDGILEKWNNLFNLKFLLRNEEVLYKEILKNDLMTD